MNEPGKLSEAVYKRLLGQRIVFLGTAIDDQVANAVMAQLLFLQFESKTLPIHLYINSPGGSVAGSFAVYDTMQFVKNPVATYAIGQASGMAALLLAGGSRGKRFALPHATVKLTKPYSGAKPAASPSELATQADEIRKLTNALYESFSRATGKSIPEIERAHEAEETFDAARAKDYGLIDAVLEPGDLPFPAPRV